jgi:hypothetical protein
MQLWVATVLQPRCRHRPTSLTAYPVPDMTYMDSDLDSLSPRPCPSCVCAGCCTSNQGPVGVGLCLQPHQDDQRTTRGLPSESHAYLRSHLSCMQAPAPCQPCGRLTPALHASVCTLPAWQPCGRLTPPDHQQPTCARRTRRYVVVGGGVSYM